MGESARAPAGGVEEAAQQARQFTLRIDGKEQGAVAAVRRCEVARPVDLPARCALAHRASPSAGIKTLVHRSAECAGDRHPAARADAHRKSGRPHVFVTLKGTPRKIATLRVAIERTLSRRLGVKMTPHQFRHLAAKIILDANPGAFELVRQLLGHKMMRTTTHFYAGPDTRRAGRAHAELINRLREPKFKRRRRKHDDDGE